MDSHHEITFFVCCGPEPDFEEQDLEEEEVPEDQQCRREFKTLRNLFIHRSKRTRCQGFPYLKATVKAPTDKFDDRYKGGGAVEIHTGHVQHVYSVTRTDTSYDSV